jgi:hypothetical protein
LSYLNTTLFLDMDIVAILYSELKSFLTCTFSLKVMVKI